jgi:hypothetical protein
LGYEETRVIAGLFSFLGATKVKTAVGGGGPLSSLPSTERLGSRFLTTA